MKINLLVLLLALLTVSACKKQEEKTTVKTPDEQEIQAVDEAVQSSKPVVEPQDDGIWTVNFDFAKKIAAEKNIDLLILFTGSDWCIWCQRLGDEVFSDEKFQEEVIKKFVPVKLDFPSKVDFPENIKQSYRSLAEKYCIRGYPTVILASGDGTPYASCGYQPGGAEAFLKTLDELQSSKKALEEKAAAAEKGGEAEAKELFEALQQYVENFKDNASIMETYAKYYDICKAKNPDIARTLEREQKVKEEIDALDKQYHMGEGEDRTEFPEGSVEEAVADYRAVIAKYGLEGMQKQEVLLKICDIYYVVQESEKIDAIMQEIIDADPASEIAEIIGDVKSRREMEELTEVITQCIVDDKKDEALKILDEKLAKNNSKDFQTSLNGMKAEVQVLFDDIEGAKQSFQAAIDLCEGEEEKAGFQSRLQELDPFNKTVTQSQLFLMRGNPQGMIDAIEKAIAEYSPDPASLQKAYIMQAQAYGEMRNENKVLETIEKAIAAMPESDLAQSMSQSLEAMKTQKARQEEAIAKMNEEREAREAAKAGAQEEEKGE